MKPPSDPAPDSRPSRTGHSHFLDIFRALAISWVILFHAWVMRCGSPAPALAAWGWMGVDLFFVLSGFLITRQLLQDSQGGGALRCGRFYALRALRILPAYAAVLGIYCLLPSLRETPRMQPFWQFASFTENLLIDYSHDKAFSHVWSLCVEEQFYLLMPFLLAFACRGRARLRACCLVAGIALAGMLLRDLSWGLYRGTEAAPPLYRYFEKVYYPGYNRLDGLLAGAVAACIQYFHSGLWERLLRPPLALLMATVLLGASSWWLFTERFTLRATLWGYPVLALACAGLLVLCCSFDRLAPDFRLPGAALLARLAYSLYLSHKLALAFARSTLAPLLPADTGLLPLAYLACILLAAVILHGCIEAPFLALRRRLMGQRRDTR